MKKTFSAFLLSMVFSTTVFAHWEMVGNADYNWGPFQIYTLSLYSETGMYEENRRPLMLSFNFDKPVEGKSFAITLIKEMKSVKKVDSDTDTSQWLSELQKIFPDFSPKDVLSYIALPEKGYFVLNNTVLDYEFDARFNQAFLASFLSPKSSYATILPQLLGKEKSPHSKEEQLLNTPDVEIINEDEIKPQLPPKFELNQQKQDEA